MNSLFSLFACADIFKCSYWKWYFHEIISESYSALLPYCSALFMWEQTAWYVWVCKADISSFLLFETKFQVAQAGRDLMIPNSWSSCLSLWNAEITGKQPPFLVLHLVFFHFLPNICHSLSCGPYKKLIKKRRSVYRQWMWEGPSDTWDYGELSQWPIPRMVLTAC